MLPASKKTEFVAHLKNQKQIEKQIAEKKLDHYTVQHGDSLSTIASKYKTTIDVLEEINQIHGDLIHLHQALLVPKVITQTAKEITVAEKKVTTPLVAKKSDDTKTDVATQSNEHEYTVRRGDNLHRLAERFDTTTYHIMRHNHLRTAALSVGQHLSLPNA